MTNRLEITTKYDKGFWSVTCKVDENSEEDFPRDIFLWTLNKDGSLNKFQAIGRLDQVVRYKSYDPDRESNFGIHLVKYTNSVQNVTSEEEVEKVITVLKAAFTMLTDGYIESTKPVIELYPE